MAASTAGGTKLGWAVSGLVRVTAGPPVWVHRKVPVPPAMFMLPWTVPPSMAVGAMVMVGTVAPRRSGRVVKLKAPRSSAKLTRTVRLSPWSSDTGSGMSISGLDSGLAVLPLAPTTLKLLVGITIPGALDDPTGDT